MAVDERFKDSPSLIDAGVHSALCVPLSDHDGRPIGLIQLDSRARGEGFAAEDLDLLAALAVPVGVAVENHRLLKERASWAAARQIQTALLPRRRPEAPGYAFWDYYRPAEVVGGDLYDYIPIEPDGTAAEPGRTRWAVAVGDVAGKGMPAALLMASICPEVRHLARAGVDPHEVLARVNRHVHDADVDGRFVTLALAELDAREHRMRVFNAGHMDPLVRRAGGRVEVVGRVGSGPPLGADPDSVYGADHRLTRAGRRGHPVHRRRDRGDGPRRPDVRGEAVAPDGGRCAGGGRPGGRGKGNFDGRGIRRTPALIRSIGGQPTPRVPQSHPTGTAFPEPVFHLDLEDLLGLRGGKGEGARLREDRLSEGDRADIRSWMPSGRAPPAVGPGPASRVSRTAGRQGGRSLAGRWALASRRLLPRDDRTSFAAPTRPPRGLRRRTHNSWASPH